MNYVRVITNIHNFSKFSKIVQSSKRNFHRFVAIVLISQKIFKKSSSRCISSCQQDIKLDQFSQQNTHCRTVVLQNSPLGAPKNMNTCDHYNYVKTKAYVESSKETCVCDSYNLSLDQALKKCIRCLQQLKKDSLLKSSAFHNYSCIGLVNDNFDL